jgi:hypothetical protein
VEVSDGLSNTTKSWSDYFVSSSKIQSSQGSEVLTEVIKNVATF